MKWQSALAIYFLFWVFSAFIVLPFGVRTSQEVGAPLVPGQADSAPHLFRPWRVVKWGTIVATTLFGVFYLNYVFGWVTPEMFDPVGG